MEAVELGAGALGFVFYPASPRFLTFSQAEAMIKKLPDGVEKVGVFVDASLKEAERVGTEMGLTGIQVYNAHLGSRAFRRDLFRIKAFRVKNTLPDLTSFTWADYFLLDGFSPRAYGGSGEKFNWELLRKAEFNRPLILAGGLTPENVYEAILTTGVEAVDVSSGVEASPGLKDREKLRKFIQNATLAFRERKNAAR